MLYPNPRDELLIPEDLKIFLQNDSSSPRATIEPVINKGHHITRGKMGLGSFLSSFQGDEDVFPNLW
jgi:hypothetical protein